MNRTLWRNYYPGFPILPCPRCNKLSLKTDRESKRILIPVHEEKRREKPDTSIFEWTARFQCFLVCEEPRCGEVVSVSGAVDYEEYDDREEDVFHIFETLRPMSMYPAPPIIAVSRKLSKEARGHLIASFGLIWPDPASCANRIRVFIEQLLVDFGVAPTRIDSKGKEVKRTLPERIEDLEATMPGHKSTFDALRKVGNIGSHEGRLKFETALDAYEILEVALEDLVDGRRARLDALKQKLSGDPAKL